MTYPEFPDSWIFMVLKGNKILYKTLPATIRIFSRYHGRFILMSLLIKSKAISSMSSASNESSTETAP